MSDKTKQKRTPKTKARFVPPPVPPVPEWLLKYESRATLAGFKPERSRIDHGPGWWLSIRLKGASISIFAEDKFILGADAQDVNPRELMARAQVVMDAFAAIAPEAVEQFNAPKQEAA